MSTIILPFQKKIWLASCANVIGLASLSTIKTHQANTNDDDLGSSQSVFCIVSANSHRVVNAIIGGRMVRLELFPSVPEIFDDIWGYVEPAILSKPTEQFVR